MSKGALLAAVAIGAVVVSGLAAEPSGPPASDHPTARPAGTSSASGTHGAGPATPSPQGAAGAGATSASGQPATSAVFRTRRPPAATTTTTTVPTTTTTTAPPVGCGGVTIPKSTGGTWQCTFDDEFDGTALDTSKWVIQQTANSGFRNGPECYVASPNNVSVANGVLSLTAREEASPFTCSDPAGSFVTQYTSGMVSTWGLFDQTYGRFEVRARLPAATIKGLQETFWLWPQDATKYGSWPASGEIDFAEFYSQYPNLDVPYIHYNSATGDPNVTAYNCTISDWSQFHTYAVEWTPSSITVLYDGATCLVDNWDPAAPLTKPQPFDQPFMIALTQALGIGTNAFDPTTTPLPATTQIDYVRAWK